MPANSDESWLGIARHSDPGCLRCLARALPQRQSRRQETEESNMNGSGAWLIVIALISASLWLAFHLRSRRPTPSPAPLVFTNHAVQRMAERKVDRRQIELTIGAPSRHARDAKNNSVRLEREVNGKTLIVWVAEPWPATDAVIVKTTAWADPTISFMIPTAATGLVIGQGGSTIRRIESANDARISVSRSGLVRVSSHLIESAESAKHQILALVEHADLGSGWRRAA